MIVGVDGRTLSSNGDGQLHPRQAVFRLFGGGSGAGTYLSALANVRLPVDLKARDPLSNHLWVFVAAMVTSTAANQAPYIIFRETRDQLGKRFPRRGWSRRALYRWNKKSIDQRIMQKGLDEDLDHPLMEVLLRPNPFQSGTQLHQLTDLWLAFRGECFWVLTDILGNPIKPGQSPERIWPLSPDLFEPKYTSQTGGDLIAWDYTAPHFMPGKQAGAKVTLPLHAVVQFKYPNPFNPVRGMSRISAAAATIESDLLALMMERSMFKNQGVPRGVIMSDAIMSEDEQTDYKKVWKETMEGEENTGKTALLTNGFKYTPIAFSPVDLALIERGKLNREGILAAMGVPQSVVGITDFVNYATQLGQDRNFLDKTIIPIWRMKEETLDGTLLFNEPDDTVGQFDLRNIESLRAGVKDKIEIANQMCGSTLHMPPRVAYEVLGLQVPQYLGDDQSFVNGLISTTVEDVLSGEVSVSPFGAPAAPTTQPDKEEKPKEVDEEQPPTEDDEAGDSPAPSDETKRKGFIAKAKRRKLQWRHFARLLRPHEDAMRKGYRSWVGQMRKQTLEKYDQLARESKSMLVKRVTLDIGAILPAQFTSEAELSKKIKPIYASALEGTYDLVSDEVGVPIFAVDDDKLIDFFDKRERKLVGTIPKTLRARISKQMEAGLKAGEDLDTLRRRIDRAYGLAASSAKSLQVARTETAGFVNGVRDEMFGLQGFTKEEWVTAGDEVVRPHHEIFGAAGPQERGFNYMELVGGGGSLHFPGDGDAPPSETVNCRCVKVPVE